MILVPQKTNLTLTAISLAFTSIYINSMFILLFLDLYFKIILICHPLTFVYGRWAFSFPISNPPKYIHAHLDLPFLDLLKSYILIFKMRTYDVYIITILITELHSDIWSHFLSCATFFFFPGVNNCLFFVSCLLSFYVAYFLLGI